MQALRVSIFINESGSWHSRPLHIELQRALAGEGIAGATVVRGVAGYTRGAGIATTSLVDAGGKLPLVVEFVDFEDRIDRILSHVSEIVGSRLVISTPVNIRHGGSSQRSA